MLLCESAVQPAEALQVPRLLSAPSSATETRAAVIQHRKMTKWVKVTHDRLALCGTGAKPAANSSEPFGEAANKEVDAQDDVQSQIYVASISHDQDNAALCRRCICVMMGGAWPCSHSTRSELCRGRITTRPLRA